MAKADLIEEARAKGLDVDDGMTVKDIEAALADHETRGGDGVDDADPDAPPVPNLKPDGDYSRDELYALAIHRGLNVAEDADEDELRRKLDAHGAPYVNANNIPVKPEVPLVRVIAKRGFFPGEGPKVKRGEEAQIEKTKAKSFYDAGVIEYAPPED